MKRYAINLLVVLGMISSIVLGLVNPISGFAAVPPVGEDLDTSQSPSAVPLFGFNPQNFVPGELIITLAEGVLADQVQSLDLPRARFGIQSLDELNSHYEIKSIRPLLSKPLGTGSATISSASSFYKNHPLNRSYVVKFPVETNLWEMVIEYKALEEVVFAEPNYIFRINQGEEPNSVDVVPNDTNYSSQSYLPQIDAPEAWDITTGSISTTIAILDTGVYTIHPDLDGRIILGSDYVNGDADPEDDNGHGTEMTGIIGAETNNAQGIAGLDWMAQLLVIKVADASGNATSDVLAQGITDAVDSGADVINISLGSTSSSTFVQTAVDYAYTSNVVVIASAGNDRADVAYYPAAYPHVMSIAAVYTTGFQADRLWLPSLGTTGTNYHYTVDLTAPGTSIYSTLDGGGYGPIADGTSASAAIVSGVAALVKALHPTWNPDQIMAQIAGSSFDNSQTGSNENYEFKIGAGRVDADGALGPEAVGGLSYAGFTLDDPNGDGDGLASPGDLVDINVSIKTYDDFSTGIVGTITTSDPYFSCGTGAVTYPDMVFGVITPSSPMTCTITSDAPIGHLADFSFTGTGSNGTVNTTFSVEIHPNPKDGWPVDAGLLTLSSPTITDFGKDGSSEIFLANILNTLNGWDVTGTTLPGWPQSGFGGFGDPAIADLDRNGEEEVILPGYVYHADGTPMDGWPVDIPTDPSCGFITAAPAIGDVTGDGYLNIVIGTWDHHVHVYNMDGTPVDGWPKDVGASVFTSVALANLDSDTALEIVVAASPYLDLPDFLEIPGLEDLCMFSGVGDIHVFNGDGLYMSGWPHPGNEYGTTSSPSVGDIDNDGSREIVAGNYAFEVNGTLLYEKNIGVRSVPDSPALGNLNGTGGVDVVFAVAPGLLTQSSEIFAVDGTGANLPGWPVDTGYTISSSPMLVDLDGNGSLEVVVTASGNRILAYDSAGDIYPGFPLELGDGSDLFGSFASPAAGDVEGDGRLDFFVPVGSQLFAWEMEENSFNPAGLPWPQYNHDLWNTGTFGYVPTASEGAITINDFAETTNSTSVMLTLSAPGATEVKISNSSSFTGINWQPMSTQVPWTISGGVGVRTVYAKFRYPDLHESAVVFDSIFIDQTVPTVEITSPNDGVSLLARRQIPIFGTATDDNFFKYESSYGAGSTPGSWTWIGAGDSAIPTSTKVGTLWTDYLADGLYSIRLIGEDTSNNQGEDQIEIQLGNIRDIASTLAPTQIIPGQNISFDIDVTNPVANTLNLDTNTTFWLHDLNPENAIVVPPFNPAGPFGTFEIPVSGIWYGQTFSVDETFLLNRVGIPISFGLGVDIELEIRPVDEAGLPARPALATATTSSAALGEEVEMIFDDVNCWLQAGEIYAVVLKPTSEFSYLLLTDDTGSLPGSAYEYTTSSLDIVEEWTLQTYDFPLHLYKALAYSANLTSPTALPSLGTGTLSFNTGNIPNAFGPAAYYPTITYEGVEGGSEPFFTFMQSDVNHVALIGDPPTITISDAVITEPFSDTWSMTFNVSLSGQSYYDITVDYETMDVEAEAGLDYEATSGTLTIPSGKKSGKIQVPILPDEIVEDPETLTINLSNPGNAFLGDDQAIGTIIDNDLPFQVSILDSFMIEGDSGTLPMPFVVYLTETYSETITVDYATLDGTAVAGEDYTAVSGTLTFTPGQTTQIIVVNILGDQLIEKNETFSVQLSNPTNVPLGDDIATGTIFDDEPSFEVFLPLIMSEATSGLKEMGKTSIIKMDPYSVDFKWLEPYSFVFSMID